MQSLRLIKYIEKTPTEDKKKIIEKILTRDDVKKNKRKCLNIFLLMRLYQEKIMNMNSYKLKDNPEEKEKNDFNIRLEIILRQTEQSS